MDYAEFIEKYFSKASYRLRKEIMGYLSQYDELSKKYSLEDILSDKHLINIFLGTDKVAKGRDVFKLKKRVLTVLAEWLSDGGIILNAEPLKQYLRELSFEETISAENVGSLYYKDFEDIMSCIDSVGFKCMRDYCPEDTLNIKSLIVLAWNGIDYSIVPSLLKTDTVEIIKNNRIKYYIKLPNNEIVMISRRHYLILRNYSECKSHRFIATGSRHNYMDSNKLFRTEKDSFSKQIIQDTLYRFNKAAKQAGINKQLIYSAITRNACFCDIRDYQEKQKIMDNRAALLSYKNGVKYIQQEYKFAYDIWKELYYE